MRIRDTLAQVLANPALRGLQASWLLGIAAEKAYLAKSNCPEMAIEVIEEKA